jgi:hypothetical protein
MKIGFPGAVIDDQPSRIWGVRESPVARAGAAFAAGLRACTH